MNKNEIRRIVLGEFKKSSDPSKEIAEIILRIEVEIATCTVRPHVSADRWSLFFCYILSESELVGELEYPDHLDREEFTAVNSIQLLETYAALERGFLFLLDHYEKTHEEFKEEYSRDALVVEAGTIAVEREMKMQELDDMGVIIFSQERAEYLIDCAGIVEFGILGGDLFSQYHL